MSQIVYENEKIQRKKVFYTGTDTLRRGYSLCYDADFAGSGTTPGKTGDATVFNQLRAWRVEKPAVGNLQHYAGVVAEGFDGVTGPASIEIVVPTRRGQKVDIWTEEDCTIDSTMLGLKAGSYAAGSASEGHAIAKALQTVDRSTTDGVVQAVLYGPEPLDTSEVFGANSRTVVQLPTAAIWNNFPIADMRANPFLGSLFESDFRHGEGLPPYFTDATYAASASGKTPTNGIYPGTSDIGELVVKVGTTDNAASEIQWPCPIALDGASWAFEIRVKCVNITTEKASWSVGLHEALNLISNLQADAGATPTAANFLAFNTDATATSALDTLYLLTGQSQNAHAAGIHTLVAGEYVTLGLYYDGTTIQQYVNGVTTGTSISAADIAASDFPLATVLVPSIAVKAAHTDVYTVTTDWIRAAQL